MENCEFDDGKLKCSLPENQNEGEIRQVEVSTSRSKPLDIRTGNRPDNDIHIV